MAAKQRRGRRLEAKPRVKSQEGKHSVAAPALCRYSPRRRDGRWEGPRTRSRFRRGHRERIGPNEGGLDTPILTAYTKIALLLMILGEKDTYFTVKQRVLQ